jgi:hypothetical protein
MAFFFGEIGKGVTKARLIRGKVIDPTSYDIAGYDSTKERQNEDASPEQFTAISINDNKEGTQLSAQQVADANGLGFKALDCTLTSRKTTIFLNGQTLQGEFFVMMGDGDYDVYPIWKPDELWISDVPFSDLDPQWAGQMWEIQTKNSKAVFALRDIMNSVVIPFQRRGGGSSEKSNS